MGEAWRRAVPAVMEPWVDWFFPVRCETCGKLGACPEHGLPQGAQEPRCLRCARRLAPGLAVRRGCGFCRRERWRFARLLVLGSYETGGMLRAWVLAFKHGQRRDLAVPLAAAAVPVLERAGWLALAESAARARPRRGWWRAPPRRVRAWIPVPVHWSRRWRRGYDQALELARELAGLTDVPCWPALYRRRATRAQGSFGAGSRARNVANAFAVHPEMRARLAGQTVVLVDDVCTSGATLSACAQSLRAAGAAQVWAFCLARVEDPRET